MSFSFTILMGLVLFCGTALSENRIKKKHDRSSSNFEYSLSTGVKRNLDQYSNAVSSVNAEVTYQQSKSWFISASLGYDSVLSTYDANQIRDVWGFGDLNIKSNLLNIGTLAGGQLKSLSYLTLPTSRVSQEASLRFGVQSGLGWHMEKGRLGVGLNSLISYSNYEFETIDKKGSAVNSPIGWLNAALLNFKVSQAFSVLTYGTLYNFQTYRGTNKAVQGVAVSTSYKFDKSISASLKYSWKDRLISNNSAFDDDTSVISFQLGFSL